MAPCRGAGVARPASRLRTSVARGRSGRCLTACRVDASAGSVTGCARPPLERFSAPVRAWFSTTFAEPTAAQAQGWPAIAAGEHTPVLAPTGSGKTLAAFLWGLDRLVVRAAADGQGAPHPPPLPLAAAGPGRRRREEPPQPRCRASASRPSGSGEPFHPPHGRHAHRRHPGRRAPPACCATRPTCSSPRPSRSTYAHLVGPGDPAGVEAVIIDEIHALAATKRGAHLALTLERLDAVTDRPVQRIGLSATQRPLDEIARFLGGHDGRPPASPGRSPSSTPASASPSTSRSSCPSTTWAPWARSSTSRSAGPAAAGPVRPLDLAVHAPPAARAGPGAPLHAHLRQRPPPGRAPGHPAQRAAPRGREPGRRRPSGTPPAAGPGAGEGPPRLAQPRAAPAHRGRAQAGRAEGPGGHVVAGAGHRHGRGRPGRPGRVARRGEPGPAAHRPGRSPGGRAQPGQALPQAPQRPGRGGRRGRPHAAGPDRAHPLPPQPARRAGPADRGHGARSTTGRSTTSPRLVRSSANYRRAVRRGAGQRARPAGRPLPVRGVRRAAAPRRVGPHRRCHPGPGRRPAPRRHQRRHHPRPGPVRRVPARRHPGGRARRGDGLREPPGRDLPARRVHLAHRGHHPRAGRGHPGAGPAGQDAVLARRRPRSPARAGSGARRVRPHDPVAAARPRRWPRCSDRHDLDERAAANLLAYLDEQAEASGGVVPDDRTIVVERFRDEIGDWRVCVHTPFGAQVHAPWGMALQARLAERWGVDVELHVERRRHRAAPARGHRRVPPRRAADRPRRDRRARHRPAPQTRRCSPGASASARPGPCCCPAAAPTAARRCGSSASGPPTCWPWPPSTPTSRSCSRPPGSASTTSSTCPRSARCSPTCGPGGSGWSRSTRPGPRRSPSRCCSDGSPSTCTRATRPLAERRAAALALDRDLLRELLGAEELRELLDPVVLADLELELQRLADGRRARDADELHDLLRLLGPLSRWELEARAETSTDTAPSVGGLDRRARRTTRRAIRRERGGRGARRRGRGRGPAARRARRGPAPRVCPPPSPTRCPDPLADLVARFARTHGPFVTAAGGRPATASAPIGCCPVLERLEAEGRVVRGEFRPDGIEREWCDDDVLRQLRRRSLAALRREVEPVEADALARFLPGWQGVGVPTGRGSTRWSRPSGPSRGRPCPASVLEADVLAARVRRLPPRRPRRAVHRRRGGLGRVPGPSAAGDGRVRLLFRDQAGLLVAPTRPATTVDASARLEPVAGRSARPPRSPAGASFWPELVAAAQAGRRGLRRLRPCSTALGPRLGRRGHQRLARAAAGPRGVGRSPSAATRPSPEAAPAAPGRGGACRPARSAAGPTSVARPSARCPGSGPPAAAGRWSLVAPLLEPRPSPPSRPTPGPASCSNATACSPARPRSPRASTAGSPPSTRCSRRSRSAARSVAATSSPAWAAPSSPCPEPSTACGPPASRPRPATSPAGRAGRHRPRPALRRRAALAGVGRPPGPCRRAPSSSWSPAQAVAYLERGGRSLVVFPAAAHHPHWAEAVARPRHAAGGRKRLEIARIDGEPAADVAPRRRAAGRRVRRRLPRPRPRWALTRTREPTARGRHHPPGRGPPAPRPSPGATLVRFEAHRVPAPWPAVGTVVTGVEARGKHLLVHFGDGWSPADPHAHDGELAPLPAGRAVAEARSPGPGRGRGRSADRRRRAPTTPAGWRCASPRRWSS